MAGSRDLTLGVYFVAGMVSSSLWGVSSLQLYSYFNSYQQDSKWLKALALAAWSLDTFHHIFVCHSNYFYLVTNWGASPPTTRIVWSVHAQTLVNPVLAFIVQLFFMFRIWRLSKQNIVITTPVAVLVLAQLISYLIYPFKVYLNHVDDFSQLASLHELIFALSVLTAISDVSLAITLTYLLLKSRTGFKRSDTMLNKLIVLTINTGLLISLNVLCGFITFVKSSDTAIYTLFYYIMARLYVNSLLANLNARKTVSGRSSHVESLSLGTLRTPNRTGGSGPLSFAREEQATHDSSVKLDNLGDKRNV